MGLMISSIARIGKDVFPKNLFKIDSDYYLYILEYSDFDFKEKHCYSSELHSNGMSRILNNYQYNYNNSEIEKLESYSFHSSTIMSWQNIFDMQNSDFDTEVKSRITPTFLFTTLTPNDLRDISNDSMSSNEFVFLRIRIKNRDANRVPQVANEMFSNVGETVSKCTRADVDSKYSNVYVFDYCIDPKTNTVPYMKNEFNVGGDLKIESSIIGANNQMATTQESSKELSFWSGVWQSIVSNVIWWILGVIATGLLMYYCSIS